MKLETKKQRKTTTMEKVKEMKQITSKPSKWKKNRYMASRNEYPKI